MANTTFATGDNLAVKLWSKKVSVEALKATWVFKFMGRDDSSVIQIYDDTSKSPGDRIRIPLRRLLSGAGVFGDSTLEGNEERITYYNDDVYIQQLRHAVREGGRFSRQLVPFDVREHARLSIQDWWADRIDTWFFNQITGNTSQTDIRYTGNQTCIAADSEHLIIAGGNTGFSLSNTSTNKFTLTLIDVAVEKAKTLAVPIRPVMVGGEQKFVMFLHHHQVTDMKNSTATNQWFDIQKAAMQGGNVTKNPIYTGALGEYNGVILHATNRIPGLSSSAGGVTGTPVRHAVLCGAQAAVMAFGRGHSPERYEWVEDYFDYENQFGVAAGCIAGLKKTVFNGSDFATIAIRTWAESHSTN
jgi:N4-gp56 family major capsid protein